MTTLRGHSRPVRIPLLDNILDHTYVTCAAGHCWPCWGDCLDGSLLRSGTGSSARADAIAEPDTHAGIRYGITGLCTQTANRILWPAGVTVADAIGYEITEAVFGTYGPSALEWVEHRNRSNGVSGELPQCTGAEAPEENPAGDAATALLSFVIGLYERFAGSEESSREPIPNLELLAAVLEARARAVLGPGFPRERIQALQDIQRDIVLRKAVLDRSLLAREMPGRQFADAANRVINDGLRALSGTLDRETYVRLFKVRPDAAIVVIRPDVCAEVYDRRPPERNT